MLLDDRREVPRRITAREHDGLSEHRAAFGAANGEDVRQTGEIGQLHVVHVRRERHAQPRAVHIERQIVVMRDL